MSYTVLVFERCKMLSRKTSLNYSSILILDACLTLSWGHIEHTRYAVLLQPHEHAPQEVSAILSQIHIPLLANIHQQLVMKLVPAHMISINVWARSCVELCT